jgi:hypothetical protein
MSKVKNVEVVREAAVVGADILPGNVPVLLPPPPAPVTKLTEEDRLALEVAKARRETAVAQAKEALAKNETAELAYKYVTLQIFMKYGLTAADALAENGDILRGGAVPPQGK